MTTGLFFKPGEVGSLTLLDIACATMSAAFFEDPLWCNIFLDEQKRKRLLARFFKAMLTLSIRQQKRIGLVPLRLACLSGIFPVSPRTGYPG